MSTRTIALVHGNFVTRRCWDPWVKRLTGAGYHCVPIAYPLREDPPAVLRQRHPDPALERLTLTDVLDHHLAIIRGLEEKPIVIGHSFGGLLTQLLVQRDVAVAGVAIDSVPPPGVVALEWSFLRSTWPVINPFAGRRPYLMSFEHWQYTFTNGLPLEEQKASYEAQVAPESRVLSRGGLTSAAKVDFKKRRAPLLLIAGEKDNIIPAALNRANYRRYRSSPSVTDFKEFAGKTHYTIIGGQHGWEEVADYATEWVQRVTGKTGPREVAPRHRMAS